MLGLIICYKEFCPERAFYFGSHSMFLKLKKKSKLASAFKVQVRKAFGVVHFPIKFVIKKGYEKVTLLCTWQLYFSALLKTLAVKAGPP